jgi:hypothetical protein
VSFHRENVVWKSSDGWYIGFYECWITGDDPEWDVEYDYSAFSWASGPYQTQDDAIRSWKGANPGFHNIALGGKDNQEALDLLFQNFQKESPRVSPTRYFL